MRTLRFISILSLFLILGCAAKSNLSSEFDESIDFDSYSTFVLCIDDLFVENTSYPNYDNKEVRQLISNEIEIQMMNRDHRTNVMKPELQAGFRILLSHEEVIFTNCDVQTEYEYWKTCTINKEIYTRETLVIYVSDMEKNQIIWQAKVDCDLNKSKKVLTAYVAELIDEIYNEYPKGSKQVY